MQQNEFLRKCDVNKEIITFVSFVIVKREFDIIVAENVLFFKSC